MQQLGRDSGGQRAIQVPWLHPSHLIYLLATSLILLTCHDLSCQALAHNSTASSSQRHTRRVLIVQEETVAGRLLNGSGESSFPSPAYEEAEEAEQDDDLLQEEEFKRRLTDVDAPTAQVAGPIATNSTTKNLQESPAQTTASSQDEEEEQERKQPGESPDQVQVKQQQQPTTSGEAGLVAAFFSHIDKQWKFAEIVLIIVISAILNLVTIIGNIMVLISFKMDRSLQTVSNYFLLSLALADLLIGLISMPLYTLYLLLNYWPLGPLMCDIWLAIDYLNSNAAVLNMLIISFDRYFSVTRPLTYRAKRTTKHACLMISFAWLLSLTIWTPAIFTYPYYKGRTVQGTDKCEIEFVKANTYLTFVTAILAFYIPVAIMIYLYWRIWLETKKRYRDLTTLFLVSGVGAAAPTRPRPPAAALLSATLTGRGGGGDGRGGSLWARNLARARQYAPSLMRGPQKAASLTPRDSPPPQQPLDRKPLPPVLTLASKTTDRLAGASQVVAAIKERPLEAGCDRQTTRHGDTNVAADSSKPSKVGVVGGGGRAESNKSQSDQQVSTSFVQKKELKNSTRQTCKCRTCSTSSHSGQSPRVSDCKACARDATSSGRHKCATSRKGACCCCDSYTAAKCAIVQPHQHNRTKYDSTKQHKNSSSSCRYCAKLTGQHSAVVSHAHSPGTGMARPEGNSDLLTLADETQPITSKATTFGSRSSLCQRSKIHPKEEEQEEARPGSSESDETGQQPPETTRLLVDVATSPINFSNTSLALVGNTGQQQQQQQLQLKLDENVIKQQLGAPPLTPVSPEVEDFETRIVSYGHKFHFETDDPKLASKRDQQRTNPCHYHQHHNHLHQRHHHHHHHQNLAQISSTRWKPAGGKSASAQSRASAGKHGTTCCCAEVISAHDAECRFCRPTHRPAQHQLATRGSAHTNHAHHQHRHHHHSHAHVQGHAHAHGHAHSGHTHQQHNHHHHHHHHHHKHHTHKHVSPGKQCNKCPQVGAPRAPTNQTDERDASLGRSLPILAALQSTHAATAAAAATNAKKYGQKLTFSDILMERSSSCVTLEQQQQPDKSNNLQVALQVVAATHDQQASPAVSESDRELLARRNADRLRSAFEYEDDEDEDGEATDADAECRRVRPNWLMRLLISVGLAAPRSNNSRGPANYHARPQRPHVHEPQTTDSSDSSDPQQQDQGKLRSQQQQQPPHHSSSTKSSSSGSQQHQQPVASPHATGSDRYHGHHHHSHHNHHHHHHHHPIQPKSERKAAKTLSTLLLVFIVTWLPYNVLVLIKTLSGGEDMVPEKIWNFSYYLCYINSTINPLCYALCNAQFRRTYMRILKCKLSNEHNSTRRLVAIQSGGGGGTGGGGSSTAKDNASRLNSSSLDGAHLLNHSSSGATLGGGPQTAPAGRYRQSSASNGAHRHSGGGGRRS